MSHHSVHMTWLNHGYENSGLKLEGRLGLVALGRLAAG